MWWASWETGRLVWSQEMNRIEDEPERMGRVKSAMDRQEVRERKTEAGRMRVGLTESHVCKMKIS